MTITLTPIGVVRSPFREKSEAPRQPRAAEGVQATIELLPGQGYEDALRDLTGWSHLWLLTWFHRADGWRPTVRPPRSGRKRGLFATRAPRRPNPIGLSVVRLDAVDGLALHVRDIDVLDGTPVLDVKPYVPWADVIPDARTGWLEDDTPAARGQAGRDTAARPTDPGPRYEVAFTPLADAQLAFLAARGVDLRPRIEGALSIGPQPHAYRRIKAVGRGFRLGVKDFRAFFRVDGSVVTVDRIASGYAPKQRMTDPALGIHRDFAASFGADAER